MLRTCQSQIRQFKRESYDAVARHGSAEVVVTSMFDAGQRLRYSSGEGPYRWVRRSRSWGLFADLSWEKVEKREGDGEGRGGRSGKGSDKGSDENSDEH